MKNDPNLFEAFTDVAKRGKREESAGGPMAPAAKPRSSPAGGGLGVELQPRLIVLLAVLIGLSFFAGYAVRGPGDQVQASGPEPAAGLDLQPSTSSWEPETSAGTGDPAPGAGTEKSSVSELSRASGLYNADNRYTVLAITYADLPSLETRARSTAQYLRDQDLPAFDPVKRGDKIEILVGAKPTKSELQGVLTKLQGTRGPNGGSFDFKSALLVRIDSHVDRN
ncbi:MAG: hypothetical protein P1V81_13830 [Planctomycetota bacterium]|nr:hypothetical protein [Planctomycetota bacterium]